MSTYAEYEPSAEYIHLLSRPPWAELRGEVASRLAAVPHGVGTVVEWGAGTGLGTDVLLDTITGTPVHVAEPSATLRAVLLARMADRADRDRVTVFPVGAAAMPLPDRIAAVLGMHMIGHLEPASRRALFHAIAARLIPGAPVILNVQPPGTPTEVPQLPPFGTSVGQLRYEGTGAAVPAGPEQVRWTMTYRTIHDDRVLAETVAEYAWWTVSADALAAELQAAGLTVTVDGSLVIAEAPPTPS